jgi:hypothetical protein
LVFPCQHKSVNGELQAFSQGGKLVRPAANHSSLKNLKPFRLEKNNIE